VPEFLQKAGISIAITAWLAKLFNSAICLSLNGKTSRRLNSDGADQFVVLEHRDNENRARACKIDQAVQLAGSPAAVNRMGRVDQCVGKLFGPHQLVPRTPSGWGR